jgi:hypothetical protein
VSLSYSTTEPVRPEVRKAIEADARRLNEEREWWSENLIFYRERDRPKHLIGDTKVYLGLGDDLPDEYGEEEDETGEQDFEDDQFMGLYEARFVVLTLARWSKEHGVSWLVEMAGAEMCRVSDGKIEPPHIFGCDDTPNEVRKEDQQAAEIRARHRRRQD